MTRYPILSDIIETVSAQFEGTLNLKNISIKQNIPNKLFTFADKNMIKTVFRNLISNAIKYSELGGEIYIETNELPNLIQIEIRDYGIGIPDEVVQKLFKIDQTHSTQGTLNETGTGLGLILCKEFIDKHRGEIWIQNKRKKGTSFFFTIPIPPI